MKRLKERIREAIREEVEIVPHDSTWPELFRQEADHLRRCLPKGAIRRIEHFGSTAVPGLAAKPIIDMLVEVTNLRMAREKIAPILKKRGYDYFWRPTFGDDVPPWYAFFIRRNERGIRTHHIHMVTRHRNFGQHWERLLFRDYLTEHPEIAREYERLKIGLAKRYPKDRVAYTQAKRDLIERIVAAAKSEH